MRSFSLHPAKHQHVLAQYSTIIFIIQATSARGKADLTLQSNPGLHAFTYYGAFADDISFGKLIVTIDTSGS